MAISFDRWKDHYLPQLADAGLHEGESGLAVFLGWKLGLLDQLCFPDRHMRVHFFITEPGSEQSRYRALSFIPEFGYFVYPRNFHAKVCAVCDQEELRTSGDSEIERTALALAAHEIRHRVQYERPNLRKYDAQRTDRTNSDVRRAMALVDREQTNLDAPEGALAACTSVQAWTSPDEYDVQVVERLTYLRLLTIPHWNQAVLCVTQDAPNL